MTTITAPDFINHLCDADLRPHMPTVGEGISVESIIDLFQRHYYPNPAYALVDPIDIYEWKALAESELATIRLIESCRPSPWAGKTCACGAPAEWPGSVAGAALCQECWEKGR